jgi:PAS domain S-box-containing protein
MDRKSHWVILISVLISVAVLAGGAWFYWFVKEQNRQSVESELQAIAELKIDQIVAWRNDRLADAEVLMNSVSLNEEIAPWIKTRDPALEEKILRRFKVTAKAHHYDRIILVGSDSEVLLSSTDRLRRISAEEAQSMASAQRLQSPVLTDLYLDPDTSLPRISVVSPVPTSAGFAIIMESDPRQFLYPMIQSWPIPRKSAETTLVRRDGDRVLYLNELRYRKNSALKLSIPLTRVEVPSVMAALGKRGGAIGTDYRGVESLTFLSAVKDSPWFMVAKLDTKEAFAGIRIQSYFILLLVLLFLAVIYLSANFVCQSIKKEGILQQAEREIRQLNADLEQKNCELVKENRERIKATEAAQGFSERLQIATRTAHIGIWDWNMVDNDLMWDDTICEIYGVPHGSFKGGVPEWSEHLHPDDRSRVGNELQAALRGECEYAPEFRIIRADGSIHHIKANSQAFWDENGKPTRIVGTNTDITEHRQAQQEILRLNAELEQRVLDRTVQLTAANQELEAFSYSVSHDLRAPLRAVDGFSRMVADEYAEKLDDEGRRMLEVIRSETQRMGQLIDDLLTFSRLGRQQTEPETIDMRELAQAVYDELLAEEPPVRKLKLDLQPLPAIEGTRTMIRQVWVNLIGNAIKFTKGREVGEIEIAAQQGEDDVPVFRIKDNGAGFDMRFADKLFGVFQRLHGPEEFPGTGVGLALVQRIVHRHGGRIWAEGKVDHGATFYFTLPMPAS